MRSLIAWSLLAGFLMLVGLWPAAAAPIGLVATGAAIVLGLIPGPVLALVGVVAWLRHRAPRPATA